MSLGPWSTGQTLFVRPKKSHGFTLIAARPQTTRGPERFQCERCAKFSAASNEKCVQEVSKHNFLTKLNIS